MMVETAYGGADRPWALTDEKPISLRMVGKKTGRDEYDTLQEKYINCIRVSQIIRIVVFDLQQ